MSPTQIQSGFIEDNVVTTAQIASGAVTTAKLDSTVSGALVPIGGIIMWSGSVATIPSSWRLCDGNNGTPNLQDKFLVGAGSGYAVGATGGENSVSLTVTQMPTHGHLLDDFYFAEAGGFSSYNDPQLGTLTYNNLTGSRSTDGDNRPFALQHGTYSTGGPDSNNYSTTSANGTAGAAHENRPPYYALAFIMRVS